MSDQEVLLPIADIYGDYLNANEMAFDKFLALVEDMKVDNYNAIEVSPVNVFYTPETRADPRVIAIIPLSADPETSYIILDGHHRHKAAPKAGLTHIRAKIKYITEADARPYFYRRHRIRGELDPLKEAEIFRHEIETRGVIAKEVAEIYGVNLSYLKTRLALLKITTQVADLFYDPGDHPGKLTTEHLKSIGGLPRNIQFTVANLSLERNWRVEDIRAEVKRIKEGKGLRPVGGYRKTITYVHDDESLEGPPPSNPTNIQRHLHPNIDRLLTPAEERIVRTSKKRGEVTAKELAEAMGVTASSISHTAKDLIKMEVLTSRKQEKEGRGRRTKLYRIWVAEEQPKSEYVRKVALTDEELFEQYPEVAPRVEGPEPETLKEKLDQRHPGPKPPTRVGPVRDKVEGPDDWRKMVIDNRIPAAREPVTPTRPAYDPAPPPPRVLTQELLEDFMEEIFEVAIHVDFNLNSEKSIDGQTPDQYLMNEISKGLEAWALTKDRQKLIQMGLRLALLYHR